MHLCQPSTLLCPSPLHLCPKINLVLEKTSDYQPELHIDGIPISKSSKGQFWPILCSIHCFETQPLFGRSRGESSYLQRITKNCFKNKKLHMHQQDHTSKV